MPIVRNWLRSLKSLPSLLDVFGSTGTDNSPTSTNLDPNTIRIRRCRIGAMPTLTQPTLDPPLKWAGGKRWLVPILRELYEPHRHRRLVEPFVGGMAVALGLQPERALLADRNAHLINFYTWLQRGLRMPTAASSNGHRPSVELLNDSETYYENRERFNELIAAGKAATKEAATLFYYLNRTGYNGLCRFNNSGHFNVPFGQYKTITYTRDFREYKEVLQDYELLCRDFEDLSPSPNDLIYADPPYDVEFTKYSKDDFTWDDQVRLAHWLSRHPGPVVASNQATERILDLYASLGFDIQILSAPRRISCQERLPADEMLATLNP